MKDYESKAGKALADLQSKVAALEEAIKEVEKPEEAWKKLDTVRYRVHALNEAYFDYAHYAWLAGLDIKDVGSYTLTIVTVP